MENANWIRQVSIFLSGQTISLLGSMLVQYAVIWHLTLETKSGQVLALATAFGFIPQAITSIFGGVWADRHNRKLLIITADATIAASTLTLAILLINGFDGLWLIYFTLAIRSMGAGVQMPAVTALIPQIVPTPHLLRINGINQTIQAAMLLLAPVAAGALYAAFDLVAVFFIDVFTAIVGIGLLLLVKVSKVQRSTTESGEPLGYFEDLIGGVRYIKTLWYVRWLLGVFGAIFVLAAAPSALTPLMIARTFNGGVQELAILEVCFGAGMLLGGVLIATLAANANRVVLLLSAGATFGVLSVGLGFSPNLVFFFTFMGLIGLAVPFFSTPAMTSLQERVEPGMQGRVFGFLSIVMALAFPLGAVIFGPLADQVSVELLLIITGIGTVAFCAVSALSRTGRRAIEQGKPIIEEPTELAIENTTNAAAESPPKSTKNEPH